MAESLLAWGDGRPGFLADPQGAIGALTDSEWFAASQAAPSVVTKLWADGRDGIHALGDIMRPAVAAGLVSFATVDDRLAQLEEYWRSPSVQDDPIARFVVADYCVYLWLRARAAYLDAAGNPLPQYTVTGRAGAAVGDALRQGVTALAVVLGAYLAFQLLLSEVRR